jgi:hypothetical protein
VKARRKKKRRIIGYAKCTTVRIERVVWFRTQGSDAAAAADRSDD